MHCRQKLILSLFFPYPFFLEKRKSIVGMRGKLFLAKLMSAAINSGILPITLSVTVFLIKINSS